MVFTMECPFSRFDRWMVASSFSGYADEFSENVKDAVVTLCPQMNPLTKSSNSIIGMRIIGSKLLAKRKKQVSGSVRSHVFYLVIFSICRRLVIFAAAKLVFTFGGVKSNFCCVSTPAPKLPASSTKLKE